MAIHPLCLFPAIPTKAAMLVTLCYHQVRKVLGLFFLTYEVEGALGLLGNDRPQLLYPTSILSWFRVLLLECSGSFPLSTVAGIGLGTTHVPGIDLEPGENLTN